MTSLPGVLEQIAAIEERPDYMGPKITREIADAHARVCISDDWLGDIIVGEIGRGCEKMGRRFIINGEFKNEWSYTIMDAAATGENCIIRWGSSPALAAALAWLAAIGGDDR